jgi:hypothetical protein
MIRNDIELILRFSIINQCLIQVDDWISFWPRIESRDIVKQLTKFFTYSSKSYKL